MSEQTNLSGTFTLPNTSITLNRIGYGAMQRDASRTRLAASAIAQHLADSRHVLGGASARES